MTKLLTGGNRGPHQCNSALQRSVQCPAPSARLVARRAAPVRRLMCQERSVHTVAAASLVAVSTAISTDRTQNAVHAEECSTSYDCAHESTPAMLQRKGAINSRGQLLLKNLTYEELEQWCLQEGERPQRARQLWRWMYYPGNWIRGPDDTAGLQDGFSRGFREGLGQRVTMDGQLELQGSQVAADGTCKLLFALQGEGAAGTVEAVIIPVQRPRSSRPHRTTLCISSQVGCAQNCQFCLTGRMGLRGNLSTAQIVEQVVEACRYVATHQARVASGALPVSQQIAPITNVVFMGMGEPLHNLEAVRRSIGILCHPQGLQLSPNRVTVSTVGLIPEMQALVASSDAQLAVSLHATTDEVRDWIAPVNRRYPLGQLMGALRELFPQNASIRQHHGRHVLFEYVMLHGINDSLEDAQRLLVLTHGIECKFNLIGFNPHPGTRFRPSSSEQLAAFGDVLRDAGTVCTVRESRGGDEMAACGQLGHVEAIESVMPLLEPPPQFLDALVPA